MTKRTCTVKNPCSKHAAKPYQGRRLEEERQHAEMASVVERMDAIEEDTKRLAAMYEAAQELACKVIARNEELLEQVKGTEAGLMVAKAKADMITVELNATRAIITEPVTAPDTPESPVEPTKPTKWDAFKNYF